LSGARWPVLRDVILCAAVLTFAFLYRFNALGGTFGGFSNDEFGYLARARQIQAGELPFRDFNDPGWFLTDFLSAAAQWLGGYNLRSEALLTVGMLSLAAMLTFVLARRASGSVAAALAAVGIHIALEPRHYNYPKLVLYALGLVLAWAYADKPSVARSVALGALVGVAFLFRHDHIVYLGALGLVTIALVHRPRIREGIPAACGLMTGAAFFVVPFLGFLAVNGGIGEYFRLASVYVQRDAQRTSFSLPHFELDAANPLISVSRGEDGSSVNIRWRSIPDDERRRREEKYKLAAGSLVGGTTWQYRLGDLSRENVEALVRDPLVEDTSGIDRANFSVAREPFQLRSVFDSHANATAFLYYVCLSLPLVAAIVFSRVRQGTAPTRAMSSAGHLVPLFALGVMLGAGFLSRGSTDIRIPDVGVTTAILLAWLLSVVLSRDFRLVASGTGMRVLLRTAAVLVLFATVLSVEGLARPSQKLRDTGFARGPGAVAARATQSWRELGRHPAALTTDDEQPRVLQLAAYIRECTAPEDRLFVLGVYPELYYFADRRFAGGHAWLLPHYYSDSPDEARIVTRLEDARVPVMLTQGRLTYDAEYRPVFDEVSAYIDRSYVEVGEVDIGDSQMIRVMARADLRARRRDERFGLPCFAPSDSRPPE
jgi:hypothetical protein